MVDRVVPAMIRSAGPALQATSPESELGEAAAAAAQAVGSQSPSLSSRASLRAARERNRLKRQQQREQQQQQQQQEGGAGGEGRSRRGYRPELTGVSRELGFGLGDVAQSKATIPSTTTSPSKRWMNLHVVEKHVHNGCCCCSGVAAHCKSAPINAKCTNSLHSTT